MQIWDLYYSNISQVHFVSFKMRFKIIMKFITNGLFINLHVIEYLDMKVLFFI